MRKINWQKTARSNTSKTVPALTITGFFSMNKKTKTVIRYRVWAAGKYCVLNTDFHENGIVLPGKDANPDNAYVFRSRVKAQNCIDRLFQCRRMIDQSLIKGFTRFNALQFEGTPTIEEFNVEVEA